MRPPRRDDLTLWALRQMEAAYQRRERGQCSREDFYDGYLQALLDNHVYSAFLIDHRPDVFGQRT
jgi:hypothetical protein